MTYKDFRTLYGQATEYDDVDMYIAECGIQEITDKYYEELDEKLVNDLRLIYELSKTDLDGMRAILGISRSAMSREYGIPLRTMASWDTEAESGRRAADYLVQLIAYTVFMERGESYVMPQD